MEFFLNGAELSLNSANSGTLIISEASIALDLKILSHMCLAGAGVACWCLTQEMADWKVRALLPQ